MIPAMRLIVNADDYGYTPGVSAGIRKAHLDGIVTSTTAMMNMPSVTEDLRILRAECPTLGVGVHLVLSAGRPVRPADRVSSLTISDGMFPHVHDLPTLFSRLDRIQLQDEWRSQIETCLATGLVVDHLDSHHHVSYLNEIALEAMLILARDYRIPIRRPFCLLDVHEAAEGASSGKTSKVSHFALPLLTRYAVRSPDRTIGSFYREHATLAVLLQLLQTLPIGTSELMCHPGYAHAELRSRSSYSAARELELSALTNPLVRAAIERRHIALINFAEL